MAPMGRSKYVGGTVDNIREVTKPCTGQRVCMGAARLLEVTSASLTQP